MKARLTIMMLPVLVLFSFPVLGQDRANNRWFDVRGWNVEIEITVNHHSINTKIHDTHCTLSYYSEQNEHSQGRVIGTLDQFERYFDEEDEGGENSGRWSSESCQGSGSTFIQDIVKEKIKNDSTCQDSTSTSTIQGSGIDPDPSGVELHIDAAAGTYSLTIPQIQFPTTREYVGMTSKSSDTGMGDISPNYSLNDHPLPKGAITVLSGMKTYNKPPQAGTGDEIQISWRVSPVGMQEVELVVDPVGYSDWIPEGGKHEKTPGNQIAMKAMLQAKDGKPLQNKAVQIVYELIDTTRLPGVCSNFPDAGDDPALDMKFETDKNGLLNITKEGQRAETKIGEFTGGQVVVTSFDWGGYSRIKVTAKMQSGEEIVGYLKGDHAQKEIRLPKRGPESRIADAWKKKFGVLGQNDYDDLDDKPELDGNKGDGLSLFEEYRGFMEDDKHIYGDPRRKELFIVDKIGGRSKDGIALFEGATNLLVHHKLRTNEADYEGVVNSNKTGNIPHLANKWAVLLDSTTDKPGYSHADGRRGGPKHIVISADFSSGPDGWNRSWHGRIITDAYAATLAHEILHTCGVKHHGESDIGVVRWVVEKDDLGLDTIMEYKLNDAGAPKGAGYPIRIFKENGVELGPRTREIEFPQNNYVANHGGQHSGVEDCLMRYAAASAYVPAGGGNIRYLVLEPEMSGIGLCGLTGGTGVNDPGRQPRSRYGNATKGNCKSQVSVNDAIIH